MWAGRVPPPVSSQGGPSLRICVLMSSSLRTPVTWDQGPSVTSCYLNHLHKGPVSKYGHICSFWGLGVQWINSRGTQFSRSCLMPTWPRPRPLPLGGPHPGWQPQGAGP